MRDKKKKGGGDVRTIFQSGLLTVLVKRYLAKKKKKQIFICSVKYCQV